MATKKAVATKRPVVLPTFFNFSTRKTKNGFSFGCGDVKLTREQVANYLKVEKQRNRKEQADWDKVRRIVEFRGGYHFKMTPQFLARVAQLLKS